MKVINLFSSKKVPQIFERKNIGLNLVCKVITLIGLDQKVIKQLLIKKEMQNVSCSTYFLKYLFSYPALTYRGKDLVGWF